MMHHIKRIIDSCETYDQIRTCSSFVEWPRPGIGPVEKAQILAWLREKAGSLHKQDMDFHRQEMAKLRLERERSLGTICEQHEAVIQKD